METTPQHKSDFEWWQQKHQERWAHVKEAIRYYLDLFIYRCPDCHKIDSILWWNVREHDNCLTF